MRNLDAATVYVSIATNFKNYRDVGSDPGLKAASFLDPTVKRNYADALADHIKFYQGYFNRVKLDLGITDAVTKTTDQRISDLQNK